MSNTQIKEEVKYTPFGTPIRKDRFVYSGLGNRKLAQFGLELDKETGSTIVVEKDPIDLVELINSYKDQCGIEYVQKLISRGLASPEDFMAPNVDYGDSSQLADNINDAYQQTLQNKSLGVDLGQFQTAADIDNYVIDQVKKQIALAQAQQQNQSQTANIQDGGNK